MAPSSGQLLVSNQSRIEDNSANYGGGIYSANGDLIVDNSTITGNSASADGGGIYTTGLAGPVTIVRNNSTISNNAAWSGNGGGLFNGGVLLSDGTYSGVSLSIRRSTFQNNSAGYSPYWSPTGFGGGLAQFDVPVSDPNVPSLSVTNSTFTGNSAGVGGGIAVDSWDLADGQTRTASIDGCTFTNNTVVRDGGGVYMSGHWASDGYWLWPADFDTISASTFTNNTAGTDLPYPYNWGGDGGGLFD
jgi:predicted outer membrane repeat protein